MESLKKIGSGRTTILVRLLMSTFIISCVKTTNLTLNKSETETRAAHHPVVQGRANQIQLRFFGRQTYVSDLYIGEPFVKNTVNFDTRTKWSGVIVNGVRDAPLSNYFLDKSSTATPVKGAGDEIVSKSLTLDWVKYDG